MRKMIFKATMVVALMFASNGVANAQLQNILGGLLGGVTNNNNQTEQKSTAGSALLGSLTGLITSQLIPTSSQIVGTWVYQEPAVVFTSDNALTKLASSAASTTIEKKLQTYLTKIGVTQGKSKLTFNSDKTFSFTYGSKSITGTYTIDNESVTLTFKGRSKASKLVPQLDNGSLIIAADATGLKNFFENIGSNSTNATLNTVASLLKKANGMKLGIRLTKE